MNWLDINPTQLIGVAVIGVLFLLVNFAPATDALKNAWGWLTTKKAGTATGTASTAIPSRRQMLDYLDASYAYFDSIGCKEGMDAINTAVDHAFKQHEKPA